MTKRAAWLGAGLLLAAVGLARPDPAAALAAVGASAAEHEVLARVNAERAALGHPALALDVRLTAAARRHAEDMRDGCFLSHTGSDGSSASSRMSGAGYPAGLGEVAAAGSWPYPPSQVVSSWMASPGHRSILMSASARHLGMGYAARVPGCPLQGHGFQAGGFWTGTTGKGPDSEFLDAACCPVPDGAPICVLEPGASAAAGAAGFALASLRRWRRTPA